MLKFEKFMLTRIKICQIQKKFLRRENEDAERVVLFPVFAKGMHVHLDENYSETHRNMLRRTLLRQTKQVCQRGFVKSKQLQ